MVLLLSPAEIDAKSELITQSELKMNGFVGYEKLNPDSLLYIFKRASEKLTLNFKKNESKKREYKTVVLQRRFRELVYIINTQKTGFLEETINRYGSYVGSLNIPSDVDLKREEIENKTNMLRKLRDRYPANSPYWLQVQQAVDITKRL